MKRLYCLSLLLVLLFSSTTTTQAASYAQPETSLTSNTTIENLGDGYYGITTFEYPEISVFSTTGTKTGTKTYNIKNSSGTTVATFKLTAKFQYSSSGSVTCTSATYTSSVKESGWSFSQATASKSGKTAYGNFTATYKVLGITTKSISQTITITCDKYGNLS